MAHWRELEAALRASNPVPKPSWISGFADRPLRKIVHTNPLLLGVPDEAIVLLNVEHGCNSPRSCHGLEGFLHRMTLSVIGKMCYELLGLPFQVLGLIAAVR